jgi:hypothetical protein
VRPGRQCLLPLLLLPRLAPRAWWW